MLYDELPALPQTNIEPHITVFIVLDLGLHVVSGGVEFLGWGQSWVYSSEDVRSLVGIFKERRLHCWGGSYDKEHKNKELRFSWHPFSGNAARLSGNMFSCCKGYSPP